MAPVLYKMVLGDTTVPHENMFDRHLVKATNMLFPHARTCEEEPSVLNVFRARGASMAEYHRWMAGADFLAMARITLLARLMHARRIAGRHVTDFMQDFPDFMSMPRRDLIDAVNEARPRKYMATYLARQEVLGRMLMLRCRPCNCLLWDHDFPSYWTRDDGDLAEAVARLSPERVREYGCT